jgi:hypothetical protein
LTWGMELFKLSSSTLPCTLKHDPRTALEPCC